jgi:hypothetical protein
LDTPLATRLTVETIITAFIGADKTFQPFALHEACQLFLGTFAASLERLD